jgi:sugar phosphate permease
MSETTQSGKRTLNLISLILAGEVIFFLPFVLIRVFRPTFLHVFNLTNLELGSFFSLYGIVAMVSYFFGGPLADKYNARSLIAFALWATGLGGLIMASIPSNTVLLLLYGFWGFTTIFLFWAALIRATREWGGDGFQGSAFGLLEGGRGLTAALIASLALLLFSTFIPSEVDASFSEQRHHTFQLIILFSSILTFLVGIMAWFFIPIKELVITKKKEKPSLQTIVQLIKNPTIWMQAIIIVCAYVGYKITDDISLYAFDVLGFDEVHAASVGTAAMWMRPVFALSAGLLADKISGSKVIILCFALMTVGGFMVYTGILESYVWIILLIIASTLVGVYGLRGVYFAVMKEAGIPLVATGTAVGIMSVIGYTPDVFMSPLMGYLLDTYPGSQGHHYVFLVLALFALVGLLVALVFQKSTRKKTAIESL